MFGRFVRFIARGWQEMSCRVTEFCCRRLVRPQQGAALVEYVLLVALIAIVAVAAMTKMGVKLSGVFDKITTQLGKL